MKVKFTIYTVAIFSWQILHAQNTYWVSNRNDGVEVDFTSLGAAYNAASPGDTLIVYPSPYGYEGLNINKEIHIRGLGYRIDMVSQPSLGILTFGSTSSMDGMNLLLGASDGSVQSMHTGFISGNNVSNYSIEKCEVVGLSFENNSNGNHIRRCLIDRHGYINNSYCCSYTNVRFINSSGSNIIENCIFLFNSTNIASDQTSENNVYVNNLFSEGITVNNSMFYNNISLQTIGSISGQFNEISNNVFLGGTPGEDDNNNIHGATNVFVGYPTQNEYSFDSRWQLAPGSPANEAGIDGDDCGIFGGQYPYKLSGIYNRPLIYELDAPLYVPVGSELPVTIKVRAEE